MEISILDLRKGPQEVEIDMGPDELDLSAEGFEFPARVTGLFRFQLLGKRVLARGHLQTRVTTVCGRCLCPVEQELRSTADLVFEPRPNVEGDRQAALTAAWEAESHEIDYYDEEMVDPTDPFRQLVLLELPRYLLCSPQCRGLCPYCGSNLNRNGCACPRAAEASAGEQDWKARLKSIHLS